MDGKRRQRCCHAEAFGLRVAAVVVVAACTVPASGQFEDPISLDTRPPKLMVLFDGRVLYGEISERPGGYMIEAPGSKQVIPYQMIRLTASSLEEAYIKQRDALTKPIAGDHLQLAQWCYDQRLYAGANEQLAAALKLEPDRSDARRLLQDVQAATESAEPPRARAPEPAAGGAAPALTAAGVSTATQADFVRRVQPILVNRCGNGSCHGSGARNAFKLANVRTGRRHQRGETEANLSAVLQQVDVQSPLKSAILQRTMDAESVAHRGLFTGPGGPAQLERLREWVLAASRDVGGAGAPSPWSDTGSGFATQAEFVFEEDVFGDAAGRPPRGTDVQQAGLDEAVEVVSPLLIEIPRTPVENARPAGSSGGGAATVEPRKTERAATSKTEQSAFLREILEQERPDAFDPNEFNRKVHGRVGGR